MMGRVPTKPGASSASETTGNQQGSAAHLQAVQPCPGHSDPTEAHGEPQTGSPVPPSSPAVYWPLCLRQDWPLLPAPLEHPLSAGLPHGKEDTLTGRSACIPCHTQLALPVSLKPWCVQLWLCPYYLCLHLVSDSSGLRGGWFYLLVQKYKKSHKFRFCRRHKMPAYAQRKLMSSCCLSEKGHHIAVPSPDISHKGLRSKRTQPADPKAVEDLPRPSSQRHEGPEFSFDLLSEARAIQVTIPPGPEVSVRLCHQWVLECEELSSPFDTQKIVSGGHAVDLPYEFLLPCLCIEASYLQEDTVRRKKCPFQNWPEASPSWNVSMDTQAQQLVLHFSSRIHATFSAAWSHPSLGQDGFVPPVYSISQTQGSSPVTLDLIIPFLKPGSCVLVWRSDVQFSWKHLLCPDVSHRHLGLLILAILALATLLGIVLALTRRRPLSGPGGARPVLLLHAADSEAQRLLVGALAELLRAALGGGRDVIVDLWEGTRVARVGPLPWLWAARARVAQEQGTVLLLWSSAGPSPARGPDPRSAPLRALLRAAPRPLLLLAYFSRLCAKGDIPQPLRALPRYRLLRDLPRLLRALDAQPSTEATGRGRLGDRQCLRGRLELCHRLEREAAKLCPPRLSRDRRRGTGWNP
ncbi:interleukin-17 receptor E isoform X10 [Canis lupus baileyi]|uniref:interleukin-17 receptor E isoform X12 n=1 Tax=Canis lupus familiaris TaxID=9615 RepID=UPI000DC6B899|nr:interleukin-17 receptor E isoform X12 [Canis lupus familiaris]XP_025306062.1 interleukin-17 receptor E isoform X10 [Canis lupus dingo]